MLYRALAPLCLVLCASPAFAQDSFGLDAHNLHPAALDGDLRSSLYVHRPAVFGAGGWYAGALLEHAKNPMVLREDQPRDIRQTFVGLDDVVAVNLGGGYNVHKNLRVQLAVPFYLTSEDANGRHGPALGDMRLDAQVILQQPVLDGKVGLAMQPFMTLPTGPSARMLGERGVSGGGLLDATLERGRWTFSGGAGFQLASAIDSEEALNLEGPDRLLTEAGIGLLFSEYMAAHLEMRMASALNKNDYGGTGSPGEAALSVRGRAESGAWWTAGLALPLTQGVGAASTRLFLGGGFGRVEHIPKDTDGDGFIDKEDGCPLKAETVNQFKDDDGCPDGLPGVVVSVSLDGEPVTGADVDVRSAQDAFAHTSEVEPKRYEVRPETTWTVKATKGECLEGTASATVGESDVPVDAPLQLVRDATLKVVVVGPEGAPISNAKVQLTSDDPLCVPDKPSNVDKNGESSTPVGPGFHKITATADGYRLTEASADVQRGDAIDVTVTLAPTKIKVEKKRIVILEKVHFELNKDIIKPDSFDLLDEVADTIRLNPEIGNIEVAGHTDSQGGDRFNLDLSARRASSVVNYLVDKGVERDRLVPVGYGETRPIDDNKTEEGRAANRRVEFNILGDKTEADGGTDNEATIEEN